MAARTRVSVRPPSCLFICLFVSVCLSACMQTGMNAHEYMWVSGIHTECLYMNATSVVFVGLSGSPDVLAFCGPRY